MGDHLLGERLHEGGGTEGEALQRRQEDEHLDGDRQNTFDSHVGHKLSLAFAKGSSTDLLIAPYVHHRGDIIRNVIEQIQPSVMQIPAGMQNRQQSVEGDPVEVL